MCSFTGLAFSRDMDQSPCPGGRRGRPRRRINIDSRFKGRSAWQELQNFASCGCRIVAAITGYWQAPILHALLHLGSAMSEISKPLQVYVVEDSPIIRRLLASIIDAAGGELVGSSAGAESAIADLSTLQPDLILIDLRLNSGSGFDVLKALQERKLVSSAIKVVLTNHANAEYENLSVSLGANGFFDKSSETSQVLALISALAAERRRGGSRSRSPERDDRENHSTQN